MRALRHWGKCGPQGGEEVEVDRGGLMASSAATLWALVRQRLRLSRSTRFDRYFPDTVFGAIRIEILHRILSGGVSRKVHGLGRRGDSLFEDTRHHSQIDGITVSLVFELANAHG